MQSKNLQDQSSSTETSGSSLKLFWDNVTAIVTPYWYPSKSDGRAFAEVIRSWGMLLLLILLIIALVGVTAFNSFVSRFLIDAIVENKDYDKFVEILVVYGIALICVTFLVGISSYVRKKIALDWYNWLNDQILLKYFNGRAYYKINFQSDIDNPDQRLAQEIEPIPRNALSFSATFLEKTLEMLIFLVIAWSISQFVATCLVVYTIVGNIISIYLTQELNKISQNELECKADYNYGLTHIRNHAESIAFFRGETQELNMIQRRFREVLNSAKRKIDWERNRDTFSRGYQAVIQIFPFIVLGPLQINDVIDFGQVAQASLACNLFANALAELINEFGASGRFASYAERLTELWGALEAVTIPPDKANTIKTVKEKQIEFQHVTLKTPDDEQVIVDDLSLVVQPHEGLLIVGPSGRGKSSLLRAIAGLWNAGSGRLIRPSLEDVLFLPQRPYLILGNLREQLMYPNINRQISDAEVKEILQQVNLQKLLDRVSDFDAEVPWENILSLGEQQRLAFARVLITRPSFTILDEATSALDLTNEGNLYQQLQATQTTFISVGHRESLFNYHQWVLELTPDSGWQLLNVQDYRLKKAKEISVMSPEFAEVPITTSLTDEPLQPSVRAIAIGEPIAGLSHRQMQALTNSPISTIRSRASLGKTVTAKDGSSYRYDKNPKVLKWVKI